MNTILPSQISLYITSHCYHACPKCFLTQSKTLNLFSLSFKQIQEIIADAKKHNVFTISVSGGEPLLHPKYFDILQLIKESGMLPLTGITGTNLTSAHVDNFKALGIPSVQVGLDLEDNGSNAFYQQLGTHSEQIKSIRLLQKSGIKATVSLCVDSNNHHKLSNILQLCKELEIFRVKIGFLESANEKNNITCPSKEIRTKVLLLCSKVNEDLKHAWIQVAGYNLKTLDKKNKQLLPPFAIMANGHLKVNEFFSTFGKLSPGKTLSSIYSDFVTRKKDAEIDIILNRLFSRYNVSSSTPVPNEKLPCAALVFKAEKSFEIFYKQDMPPAIQFFTQIHEVGHIALNKMHVLPGEKYSEPEEKEINLWALKQLEDDFDPSFLAHARFLANENEAKLFKFIEHNLLNNFISHWEN